MYRHFNTGQGNTHHSNGEAAEVEKIKNIQEIFMQFAGPPDRHNIQVIDEVGLNKLMDALDRKMTDRDWLIFCWKFQVKRPVQITMSDFIMYMLKYNCDSLDAIREFLARSEEYIDHPLAFRRFYKEVFELAGPVDRQLHHKVAERYWRNLLDPSERLEQWFSFLDKDESVIVTSDVWEMFLVFFTEINSAFSNYDFTASWPACFDDFVDFCRLDHQQSDAEFLA